jgi:hypothetical protein
MKKTFATFSVLVLTIATIASATACGKEETPTSTPTPANTTVATTKAPATTTATTKAPENNSDGTATTTPATSANAVTTAPAETTKPAVTTAATTRTLPSLTGDLRPVADSEFTFEIKPDGKAKLTAFKPTDKKAKVFTIPSKYDGALVDEIADKVFYDNDDILMVICPGTIAKIGESAFAECDNLNTVQIGPWATQFGKDLFKNSPKVEIFSTKGSDIIKYAKTNSYKYVEDTVKTSSNS